MNDWWDSECNEYLKTLAGLRSLIANSSHGETVLEAVRFAHIDYNWPLNMLP